MTNTHYHQVICDLSERLVNAQRAIRILDALKWHGLVEADFFKSGCKELPKVQGPEYYEQIPLRFEADKKMEVGMVFWGLLLFLVVVAY